MMKVLALWIDERILRLAVTGFLIVVVSFVPLSRWEAFAGIGFGLAVDTSRYQLRGKHQTLTRISMVFVAFAALLAIAIVSSPVLSGARFWLPTALLFMAGVLAVACRYSDSGSERDFTRARERVRRRPFSPPRLAGIRLFLAIPIAGSGFLLLATSQRFRLPHLGQFGVSIPLLPEGDGDRLLIHPPYVRAPTDLLEFKMIVLAEVVMVVLFLGLFLREVKLQQILGSISKDSRNP